MDKAALEKMVPPNERWWGPDDELVDCQEVIQVQERVGLPPRARLKWALDFARRDLGRLTTFDWENLRREIAAFALFLIPYDRVGSEQAAQRLAGVVRDPDTFPRQPPRVPSREQLETAHDEVQ